jgi:hypothetical protein
MQQKHALEILQRVHQITKVWQVPYVGEAQESVMLTTYATDHQIFALLFTRLLLLCAEMLLICAICQKRALELPDNAHLISSNQQEQCVELNMAHAMQTKYVTVLQRSVRQMDMKQRLLYVDKHQEHVMQRNCVLEILLIVQQMLSS